MRQVLAITPRAFKIAVHTVMLGLPYSLFEQARLLVAAQGGTLLDQNFAAEVTLTARFPVEKLAAFQAALSELSNGALQAEIMETSEELVPVQL